MLNLQLLCDLEQAGTWKTPFFPADLRKHDPMNIPSSLRLISAETTTFLENLAPRATNPYRGLIAFLTTLREFVHGFIRHDLGYTILERIRDVATAISFCRYWRIALVANGHSVSDSFLTQNAFEGMELNLHSLVHLVRFLKPRNAALRIWLLGSQVLERLFRIARAYSPGGSTMVNVDLEGFLQRLKSILFDQQFLAEHLGSIHKRHGKANDLQHPDPSVRAVDQKLISLVNMACIILVSW